MLAQEALSPGPLNQLLHTHRPPPTATQQGEAPLELEKVDEVLRRHGHEAAVGVCGRAGVSGVLREEWRGVTHISHQLLL